MKPYKKLSEIKSFTVQKFLKKYWQRWDELEKKFLKSDSPAQGFSARYLFEMFDCLIPLSQDQVGQMLVATLDETKSDLEGKSFTVKTNGQTGKEIRYWINLLQVENTEPTEEEIQF